MTINSRYLDTPHSAQGLLISNIMGISQVLGNDDGWRYLLGLTIVPCGFQLIALLFAPESPRWLYMSKHDEPAAAGTSFIVNFEAIVTTQLDLNLTATVALLLLRSMPPQASRPTECIARH